MDLQEWRDIDEFPHWLVSSEGHVMNGDTGHVMTLRTNQQHLTMVNIYYMRKIYTRLVALLVGHAFLEIPDPDVYNSVIHLNGDRSDCRAMNLMWRPRWFGLKYHHMFTEDPVRVAVYIPAIKKRFSSLREFCTTYGLIEKDTYMALLNHEPCFHYGWLIERFDQ